jgi:NAD(P)H dehydrogenase (quinone)
MRWILIALLGLQISAAATRVLIVYHSDTGNTEQMARAVRDGVASVPGVEAVLRKTGEATDADIAGSAGILLGAPVHWQAPSAEARRFMDRLAESLAKAGKTWGEGKLAGVFVTVGSPGNGQDLTRVSLLSSLLSMRFVVAGGVNSEGYGTLGPMAVTGPASPGIDDKEKAEARAFGERFARLLLRRR